MKLIIDIPDSVYRFVEHYGFISKEDRKTVGQAILQGAPYNPVVDPCDMNMFDPDGAILGKGEVKE